MRLNEHKASPTYELLKSNVPVAPEIRFTRAAVLKQEEYVAQSPDEVGWMGYAEKVNDLLYVVKDTFLLPQSVTGGTTQIDPDAWFKMDEEISSKTMEGMKFWGHSHVTMGVTPSGTDDKTMETLSLGKDWFIRAILNKKGEMKVSFFNYEEGIAFHDCPWGLPEDKQRAKVQDSVEEELKRLVRKASTTKTVDLAKKSSPSSSENILNYKQVKGGEKKDDIKYPKEQAQWLYDLDQKKFVEVRSENHALHLLGKWHDSKSASIIIEPDIDEQKLIEDWFNGKLDDPYYYNGGY